MATEKKGSAFRRLREVFNVGAIRELTDGQLLERFATERGEGAELAFAALVERHGPMVLRVCRGVLGDAHDAQDAFQATFLVLVRRARGLWVRDSLGPWLHQVARRTAACARSKAARRRHHEREAAGPPREDRTGPADDLARLLHEEVDRLPGRFRAAVVLCDLEGRTHEQAARHLGWPVGTVKSRLTRGRARLRDRLVRRGLAPGAGVLVASSIADASIPSSLVDSAVLAASRSLAAPGLAAGPAAILAREVLRSMTLLQWFKVAASVLAFGVTASGVGLLAGPGQAPGVAPKPDGPPVAAKADEGGSIEFAGSVEAARSRDVLCEVEGSTTILRILPEGTKVKAGDIVAELDSASLRDSLVNQRITIQQAEASYNQAVLSREVAEIAVKEYELGLYPSEREAIQGEINRAQAALPKAEARRERTRRARDRVAQAMALKGNNGSPADIAAELDIEDRLEEGDRAISREKGAIEEAQTRLDLLQKYTWNKRIKSLKNEAEKARAVELNMQSAWQLEKSKEAKLERQIRACVLKAPGDGVVVYAKDPPLLAGRNQFLIEEGANVRLRQLIFRVKDLDGPIRVTVKVPEVAINRVKPGSKVKVSTPALPGKLLDGVVAQVAPFADADTVFRAKEKFYTVHVRIDDAPTGLRPRMLVKVEIPLGEPQPPR